MLEVWAAISGVLLCCAAFTGALWYWRERERRYLILTVILVVVAVCTAAQAANPALGYYVWPVSAAGGSAAWWLTRKDDLQVPKP